MWAAPDGATFNLASAGTGVLAGTPLMHSNLNGDAGQPAPAILYLDWSADMEHNANAGRFDLDGSPNNFNSEKERLFIWENWRNLSEYFSQYNIDVTTERPNFSTRKALWMSVDANYAGGGIFQVGPAPATAAGGGQGQTNPYAEPWTFAHEFGHGLNNDHQSNFDSMAVMYERYGTNPTVPDQSLIMGGKNGSVQRFGIWTGENNPADIIDADARIVGWLTANIGGTGRRVDQISSTLTSGATVTVGTGYTSTIETLYDVDAFKFTSTGGAYQITVGRKLYSQVDLKVSVYNSNQVLIATSDGDPNINTQKVAVSDTHITIPSTTAGTYYVKVESRKEAGALGSYTVQINSFTNANWKSVDIGLVLNTGYVAQTSSTAFNQVAAGSDISGSSDEFQYMYQQLQGDGTITARVIGLRSSVDFNGTNPPPQGLLDDWAKAGIMIRNTLDPNSANVALVNTARNGVSLQWRDASSGGTSDITPNGGAAFAAKYLKLTRAGSTITAQWSDNNSTWNTIGTVNITGWGGTIQIGLCTTAHDSRRLVYSTFTTVSVAATGSGVLNPAAVPNINTSLPVPTGLVANAPTTGGQASVSWTKSTASGVIGYTLEFSNDGQTWTNTPLIVAQPGSGTTVTATQSFLGDDNYRWYRVRTRNSSNQSSNPTGAVAAYIRANAPANLRASVQSDGKIVLSWGDVGGESGYLIERSTNGGANWSSYATTPNANQTFYVDSGTNSTTKYMYRVSAYTTVPSTISATSNVVSAGLNLSSSPVLSFGSISTGSIGLTWTPVSISGGVMYEVQRSTHGNPTWAWDTLATGLLVTNFTDTNNVQPATEYYYRVRAVSNYTSGRSQSNTAFRSSWGSIISGWSDTDLGVVGGPGAYHATNQLNGDVFVIGSGADVWGNRDDGRYLFRTMTGNGFLVAHVADYERGDDINDWARVGIDFRENNNADAKSVGLFTTDNNGLVFQVRSSSGGTTSQQQMSFPPGFGSSVWLELDFFEGTTSDTFSAWFSFDSTDGFDGTWTPFPNSFLVPFNHSFNAGLLVCSHDNNFLETARFDHIGFSSSASASALTPLGSLSKSETTLAAATLAGASGLSALTVSGPMPFATAPSRSTSRHTAAPGLTANALTLGSSPVGGGLTNDLLLTLAKTQAKKRSGLDLAFASLGDSDLT